MINRFHKHTVWLMGGLGNQLFQIQFGLWLARESQYPVIFNRTLTNSNFFTKTLRWSIHDNILDKVVVTDDLLFSHTGNPFAILSAKLSLFNKFSRFYGSNFLEEDFCENIFGYFQCAIFNELVCDENLINIRRPNSWSDDLVMHLRGGDINDMGGALKYYNEVLYDLPSSEIRIVTDTQRLLKKVRSDFPKHVFIDVSSSASIDFLRLAGARKVILAPSTFSWWAARLGKADLCYAPSTLIKLLGSPRSSGQCNIACY